MGARTQPEETGIGFSVHAAPAPEGGMAVTVFGELDLASAPRVREALEGALDGEGEVVVDLRACTFVDSTGMAVLAAAAMKFTERDRRFVLRGVRPRVLRVLEVAGLTSHSSVEIEPAPPGHPRGR
jgi:anti-sigma B factor antagonist